MRRRLAALVLVLPALVAPARAAGPGTPSPEIPDLAAHVDPFVGTFPPGFVFPGASVPFGMVQNSPDTDGEFAYSGYLWTDANIRGFSPVHLNGPGVRKGGDIPFMPTVGPVPSTDPRAYASPFDHGQEEASPGYYRVRLHKYLTDVELTAGTRVGMQRYTFPPAPQANVIVDAARAVEGVREGSVRASGPAELEGHRSGRYTVYFVARFDRPFSSFTPFADGRGGWATFDAMTERQVTMKVGISFVDLDGARRNLESEAPGDTFDFEGMRAAARDAWNRELARIRVTGGSEADRRAFYTALFHAQQHPNVFSDVDGRYAGYDKAVHRAEGRLHYANFSSWDTYKAQNQLLATIQPERYREMLVSLLENARHGGKLPRWGEQNLDASHMSGDPVIPMIADGVCRGLVERPLAEALYDEAVALATVHRPAALDALGWLPDRPGTTLEYGVADFALALLADGLGRPVDASRWLDGSLRYRTILDPETRWIRPRAADGSWHRPFDPSDQTGFQEGNSWQYSWLAPHDARGLFDRMGGDGVAIERLDVLFALPPEAQSRATLMGTFYGLPHYAPGNEHDLQVPWMYPFAGQPWRTQHELRELQALFRPTPDGLPGNDDLGSLSAWHVWSALGIGPVTPGAPFFVVGSPQFERAELYRSGGPGAKPFVIEAPGASVLHRYVARAELDGRPLAASWIGAGHVRPNGTLRLDMSTEPDLTPRSRPPSVSDSPLAAFGCRPT